MPVKHHSLEDNKDYVKVNPLCIDEYTTLSIHLFRSSPMSIHVIDKGGIKVSVIFDGWLSKGNHTIQWYAEAFNGTRLMKGEYNVLVKLYQQETNLKIQIR